MNVVRKLLGSASVISLCIYVLASAGFDVHVCADSGRVYVGLLVGGVSCETIHPDVPCHHHGHDCCEDDEDCCSDEIAVLSITGDGNDQIVSDFRILSSALFLPSAPQLCVTVSGHSDRRAVESPPQQRPALFLKNSVLRV